ncbi:hypothetical protein CHUAL_004790 [Chamberlinius hualienensis]
MDLEKMRETLRTWREDNVRQSEEVMELWEMGLNNNIKKLGDEMWQVYEQVCMAAYDCHRLDVSRHCITKLNKQFPQSIRVAILRAMEFEVLEQYDKAMKLYDDILKHDKTNLTAQKRKIAILKAQGKIPEAIKELTDYLKKFMSDQESWLELSDFYIMEQEYSKAAFCMEELILFNPHNHLYYQRYAEIKYTQGGTENIELARSYFAQAVKMNPNNTRALYGLYLASRHLADSPKCSQQKKEEYQKIAEWAAKQARPGNVSSSAQQQTWDKFM